MSSNASHTDSTKRTNMTPQDKVHADAFSHYSSHTNLMNKLLMKDVDSPAIDCTPNNASNGSKRRRNNQSRPIRDTERKTRLTWEVHPSLLIDDLLLEDASDMDEHAAFDEEDDDFDIMLAFLQHHQRAQ